MDISKSLTSIGNKALGFVKKNSSQLMAGGAIVFGIGTVVLTWFAARKTDEALTKPKEIIKTAKERPITDVYTKEDRKKDISAGYKMGAAQIAKLYIGPVTTGIASAACVYGLYRSNRNLASINAGLIASNSILYKELESCTKNITEKYGKEEAMDLLHKDKMEEVEQTVTDKNGEEKTEKIKTPRKDYEFDTLSRCFCDLNVNWTNDETHNQCFLKAIKAQLNQLGHDRPDHIVWLNDAYDYTGFQKTQAGYRYGWIFDPKDPYGTYVDFGIEEIDEEGNSRFIYKDKRNIWLRFNCQPIDLSRLPIPEV